MKPSKPLPKKSIPSRPQVLDKNVRQRAADAVAGRVRQAASPKQNERSARRNRLKDIQL